LLLPLESHAPLQLVHEGHAGAAQASGVVNTIDAAHRKVNVSHGSIKQLGWPAMTMDFPVSADVDLTTVKPGMKVNFTLVMGSRHAESCCQAVAWRGTQARRRRRVPSRSTRDQDMRTVIQTVIAVLLVQMLAAVGFVYSGMFNVAATDPHWSLTHAIMETARV